MHFNMVRINQVKIRILLCIRKIHFTHFGLEFKGKPISEQDDFMT